MFIPESLPIAQVRDQNHSMYPFINQKTAELQFSACNIFTQENMYYLQNGFSKYTDVETTLAT